MQRLFAIRIFEAQTWERYHAGRIVAMGYVGHDYGLVKEHQRIGIQIEHHVKPGLADRPHIGAFLDLLRKSEKLSSCRRRVPMADRNHIFTPKSRAEAVRLAQMRGWSRREITANLGVRLSTLRNWIDGRHEREMDHPPADRQE